VDKETRTRLIQRYGDGPEVLWTAWNECPSEARNWKPSSDAWSVHEIVIHCADSETFAFTRIRLLNAEPQPIIVGYDQDAWVRSFGYEHLPVDLALATIAAVRASTFHLIQRLDNLAWNASGNHLESGPYTATDWLATYAAHLHDHADQIQSNVTHWRGRQ